MVLCSLAFLGGHQSAEAAVPVHINSGNPAFPFPQFLDYAYGDSHRLGNLGTKNAEGVVHAELEQDIRDAYQIHANEFNYTGEEYKGIKYIETTNPEGGYYGCTESQGYGLLAAAYMADQVTFNGYWFWVHDYYRNKSKRYNNGAAIAPGYEYGVFTIGDGEGGDSAADGDVDVALALYVAYKQWGEFMKNEDGEIVTDYNGNPISYKKEMIEVIRGLVTLCARKFKLEGDVKLVQSGVIGLDGYPNGGNTWTELTDWCANATPMSVDYDLPVYAIEGTEVTNVVLPAGTPISKDVNPGPAAQHIDYFAPAYFREFWELFEQIAEEENIPLFDIEQFKRAEASSDWLMKDLISKNPKAVPIAGWVEMDGKDGNFSYSNYNQGEDYRSPWRTISNYMWHGNPTTSWNPQTHKVESGSNTYEYDAAVRMSDLLENPIGWATGECMVYGDPPIPYSGPSTTEWQYDPMTGMSTDPEAHFMVINWLNGTGSFSAVSTQRYDLMGELYRQCAIEWDYGVSQGDYYLTGVPHYMHGWFRQLGMMVTSGNYHAPSQMNPGANMKIYRAIEDSVTYCYTGDQIKFLLDYRNYGSVDAKDVVIVEKVPEDFVFIEASDGGVYDKASHTVTWNIGTVSGVKSDNKSGAELDLTSGNLAKTVGQVWYKLKAGDNAGGRYCTTAEITCSNGLGWTSNEYPNYKTATMQRNCVDVVARSLTISKEADRTKVNDGNMVTYTVKFENSSEAGWIDGGRPRVNVSFANGLDGSRLQIMARLWNDAIEPYINYGNYRISYFLYDAGYDCYSGDADCPTGWSVSNEIYEGGMSIGSSEGVVVSHENIVEKNDEFGRANQRLTIQFAPLLITTTMHVSRFFGGAGGRVHKGGTSPMRGVWAFFPSNYGPVNWEDDWSYSSSYNSVKDGLFYPVTPSWQKLDEKGKSIEEPVTKWLTCGCEEANLTVPNILVEEYDGYVWRRILGDGPTSGRDVENVEVRDTLPKGLKFDSFVNECPLSEPEFGGKWEVTQTSDGRDVIVWSIPKLQAGRKGSIVYTAVASFPSGNECETPDEDIINYAWIAGDKNSAISDTAKVTVTCAKVPKPIKPTTLTKESDKDSYEVGEEITYTIGYKQTHGAIFDDALEKASDWTLSGAQITGGTLSITQGNKATFNNSLSKNIYVEMDANIAEDQEGEIIFRDNIRLQFKYNKSNGLSVTCYDGAKQVEQQICGLKNNPSRWRIKLQDDILQVWFGKDTSAGAGFTASGLTEKEGKLSFNGAAWGNFQYSKMHIHTDYAYDLAITDFVPAEVSVDEGSFESYHNGVSAGTGKFYKAAPGSDEQDRIEWTDLAQNPIAYGDTFTIVWKGTVESCEESIVNVASAKLLGHADDEIMAQAVSECGTTCPIESVVLKSEATEFCVGDSVLFTAAVEPEGDYLYEFFLDGESLGEPSDVSEMYFSKEGDYTVRAYDAADAACNMLSKPKALAADSIPPFTLGKDVTVCEGQSVKFGTGLPAGYTFEWSTGSKLDSIEVGESGEYVVTVKSVVCEASDTVVVEVAEELVVDLGGDTVVCETLTLDAGSVYDTYVWYRGAEQVSEESAIEVSESGEYRVEVTQGACGGSGEVSVKVSPATVPSGTFKVSYVVSDTASDGAFGKSLTEQDGLVVDIEEGYVYNWYDADKKPLDGVPTPDVPEGGGDASYTYYVSRTNADGCESELVEVTVTVSGAPVPVAPDVVLCVGDEASALEAAFTDNGGDVTWELRWYDADGNALDGAPVPSSDKAGEAVYYVSQVSSAGAESGKVPVKVTVYGVGVPDVSDIRRQYCEGELLEEMSPVSGADEESFVMGGKFEWSRNGTVTEGTPIVGSKVETTTYGVREYYEVAEGKVCKGEEVLFDVVLTEVAAPSGDLTVNYLKREGADGGFAGLLEQNPGVAKAEDGKTLVWFDADGNELDGVPAPEYSADWAAGEDVVLAYKVAQRDEATGCMSDTLDVTVTISDSPMPKVSPVGYCEGAAAVALTAEVSEDGDGTEYELVWFGVDGGQLDAAPVPDTKAPGEYVYKVAQRSKAEPDNVSSKASLKVTVYALPVLEVDAPDAKCGGNVELSGHVSLKDGSMSVTMGYYKDAEGAEAVRGGLVSESGTYYADASYTINATSEETAVCRSEMVDVKVVINDISGLKVEGPATVCPGGEVVLKASAESSDPGAGEVVYRWSGAAEGEGAELGTGALEGSYGTVYEYEVVAEAGACAGADALKASHKVTVSRGVLDGAVTANGVKADVYRTCGGEVELVSTHSGTDVRWSDASGAALGEGATLTVSPESTSVYVVTLTNVCEASDTVTVSVHPLSAAADWSGLDGSFCEGDDVSAKLSLEGYDAAMSGAYIKWFRDGEELSAFAGSESLSIKGVGSDDAGVYSYRVSNGICERPESADEGSLVVVSPASYTKPDGLVVCEGSSADVALKLEDDDVEVAWFDGQKGAEASFALDATSYVRFTLTRPGGCVQNDSVLVTVDSQVELELSADTTICKGEGLALEVRASGNGLGYRWELDGELLGSSPRLSGLVPMESSVYGVTVTSRACEPVRGEVAVEVASLPVIYEIADVKTRTVEVVLAEGYGSSPFMYSVDGGDYVSDPVFTLPRYGRHVYRVSDANGCVGTMAHELEAPSINIPSSFSPGGDGIQDKWEVPELSETYPEATIVIFDRFGKKLVEFKASEGGWDGMYNGKRMPSTDYWYEIDIDEIDKTYVGHFTLISE